MAEVTCKFCDKSKTRGTKMCDRCWSIWVRLLKLYENKEYSVLDKILEDLDNG